MLFTTRLTWREPLVNQELITFPEHLSSLPVFSGVRVTRSLVLYVCFVYVVCPFVLFLLAIVLSVFWPLCCLSFGHCVVCLLAIVLSVLLRFTDTDNSFCIFKLFLLIPRNERICPNCTQCGQNHKKVIQKNVCYKESYTGCCMNIK